MSSIQRRIASLTNITTNLIVHLSELERLRHRVREARLAAERSLPMNRESGAVELKARLRVNPQTPAPSHTRRSGSH
jgi:hypothetical protein